jgi:hypothetical protein
LADRQPRPDLIEKRIGEFHRLDNGLSSSGTRSAIRHHHHYPPLEQKWNACSRAKRGMAVGPSKLISEIR